MLPRFAQSAAAIGLSIILGPVISALGALRGRSKTPIVDIMNSFICRRDDKTNRFVVVEKISEEQTIKLAESKDLLLSLLKIEENISLLIDNYKDLQNEILRTLQQLYLTGSDSRWSGLDCLVRYNGRAANLLASFKSYVDHIEKKYQRKYNGVIYKYYREKASEIFDHASGRYKFACKLRNYCQHFDLPAHGYGFTHGATSYETKESMVSVRFYASKKELLRSPFDWGNSTKFLEGAEEEIEITNLLSDLVFSVLGIHRHLMGKLNTLYSESNHLYSKYFDLEKEDEYYMIVKTSSDDEKGVLPFRVHESVEYNVDKITKRLKYYKKKNDISLTLNKVSFTLQPASDVRYSDLLESSKKIT